MLGYRKGGLWLRQGHELHGFGEGGIQIQQPQETAEGFRLNLAINRNFTRNLQMGKTSNFEQS
jgi:hypothetical protein